MTSIAKENLDERIERIKKRNEEIEKKYREAEEDRLMALKDNAMVKTKPPKDEDWPKAHKYDKLDFTYDVNPEKLEESNKRKLEESKLKRDYKKFAEGEGPPPDPAYNFLADAERDGHKNDLNKKDLRQNNNNVCINNKNNNKDYQQQKQQQHKRGGPNNGSFRGRNGGSNNSKGHNSKYQKQNSQPEYEQWRNERERIDEARINRQKIGEGKWKREWDNNKSNGENEALLHQEHITMRDVFNSSATNSAIINKTSPIHNNIVMSKMIRQNSEGHNFINSADCLVEKRANITVSISQTGEVKSVKLTSAPPIGTGRVGPRQISKPQFSIQTIEKEIGTIKLQSPPSPRLPDKVLPKSNTISNINISHMNNNNGSNMIQKVSNNKNIIVNENNPLILSPPNINSIKSKKDKTYSPKQLNLFQQGTPILGCGSSKMIKSAANTAVNNQQVENYIQSSNIINQQQQLKQQQHQHHKQQIQALQLKKAQKTYPQGIQSVIQKPNNQQTPQNSQSIATIPLIDKNHLDKPLIDKSLQPKTQISSTPLLNSSAAALPTSLMNDVATGIGGGTNATILTDLKLSNLPLQQSLSANEIIPVVVDLSHKPEFAKKSIQDRLLRVRQTNQTNSNVISSANNNNISTSALIINSFDESTNSSNNMINQNSAPLDDFKVKKVETNQEKVEEIDTMMIKNENNIQICDNIQKSAEPTTAVETIIACN